MSAVGANNASDIGLIVQGTLIFMSACIAVVGYVVQSRLSAKAHARQLRLEREERHKDEKLRELRTLLSDVIGPIQSYIQAGNNMLMGFGLRHSGHVEGQKGEPMESMVYFPRLLGGKEKLKSMFSGNMLGISSWLLPELLKTIEAEPNSRLARDYRMCVESALSHCWIPAAKLMKHRLNDFPFPSREAFKKRFPCYAKDLQLRKKMLLEFVDWACALDMILQREWKEGDFSRTTTGFLYPTNINTYMIMMVDALKEDICLMTDKTFDFKLTSTEEEYKNLSKMVDRAAGDESAKIKQKKRKYAVATTTAVAGQ